MPLVFVHGVNVRQGQLYEREQAFRDRNFIDIFYRQLGRDVSKEAIFNPYWGDLGANISDDNPFLPRGRYQTLWAKQTEQLRSAGKLPAKLEPEDEPSDEDRISETHLLDLARNSSLADAVDYLCDVAQKSIPDDTDAKTIAESAAYLADFSVQATSLAGEDNPDWLNDLKSDEELLLHLEKKLNESNSDQRRTKFSLTPLLGGLKSKAAGFRSRLRDARIRAQERIRNLGVKTKDVASNVQHDFRGRAVGTAARVITDPLRMVFHQQFALLIGDSFEYFNKRGDESKPSPIAERVMESLRQAVEMKKQLNDELIVIGHSMGGIIMCDIVTCYGTDIPIDYLITVGSQYPLFADLQMFPGIRDCVRPIPKPANVGRWINIFDPHDLAGYPASHIFADVDDYHLPTYRVGSSAHVDYFNRRSFYTQLARRMQSTYLTPGK